MQAVLAALYSSVKKYLYDDCSVWCMMQAVLAALYSSVKKYWYDDCSLCGA